MLQFYGGLSDYTRMVKEMYDWRCLQFVVFSDSILSPAVSEI